MPIVPRTTVDAPEVTISGGSEACDVGLKAVCERDNVYHYTLNQDYRIQAIVLVMVMLIILITLW